MKKVLVSALCFISFSFLTTAQVGIGTTTPRASLEISNAFGGGVLVPSYELTAYDDIATVTNPQPSGTLEKGTVVFNLGTATNSTGPKAIKEGFVHWDGTRWKEMGSATKVMMRKFPPTNTGTTFNFPSLSFTNIDGTSYNNATSELTLPRGVYQVESNLRLNSNSTIDWATIVDGSEVSGSVRGSANPPSFNSNASAIPAVALFEITAETGELQFRVVNASGTVPPVFLEGQCYLIIKKID